MVGALVAAADERRRQLARLLGEEPGLVIWAAGRFAGEQGTPPTGCDQLGRWLAERLPGLLSDDGSGAGGPLDRRRLERLRRRGRVRARRAVELAGEAADSAGLAALLLDAPQWLSLGGLEPGGGSRPWL